MRPNYAKPLLKPSQRRSSHRVRVSAPEYSCSRAQPQPLSSHLQRPRQRAPLPAGSQPAQVALALALAPSSPPVASAWGTAARPGDKARSCPRRGKRRPFVTQPDQLGSGNLRTCASDRLGEFRRRQAGSVPSAYASWLSARLLPTVLQEVSGNAIRLWWNTQFCLFI